jgi:hypothetical protein
MVHGAQCKGGRVPRSHKHRVTYLTTDDKSKMAALHGLHWLCYQNELQDKARVISRGDTGQEWISCKKRKQQLPAVLWAI